jgi:5-methylcytosine-specific restriction endonuclease McrA
LIAVEGDEPSFNEPFREQERRRIIPTPIKIAVWKRDKGRCVLCGRADELHFDHLLPFSKGGTSLRAENVQLLCARHNLSKADRIL